jgi:transitional endoplasmic reticulum ATPase
MTNGYVAADLMALCREAINHAIEKWMRQQSEPMYEDVSVGDKAKLTLEDFAAAMAKIGPSIQRGFETMVEKKTWEDIGGLEPVKQVT